MARLAGGGPVIDSELDGLDFHARIDAIADTILKVYRITDAAQSAGETVTPAAQWLLDNHYLIEEAIYQVKRNLPPRFYRQLPTVRTPGGRSIPRVLAIAWAYVSHTDSTVMLPVIISSPTPINNTPDAREIHTSAPR